MDLRTAHILTQATKDFYAHTQASFSATRQKPWSGWERILPHIQSNKAPLRVLDLGCGNMRFERFLEERLPEREIIATMVDACKFDDADFPGEFIEKDIVAALLGDNITTESKASPRCTNNSSATNTNSSGTALFGSDEFDLVVAFGLAHHLPTEDSRRALIQEMISAAAIEGIFAISFWQPLNDERIASKARTTTPAGCEKLGVALDEAQGDLLLGWQDNTDVFRYCHHFADAEIDELAKFAEGQNCAILEIFTPTEGADRLNTYLILQKHA